MKRNSLFSTAPAQGTIEYLVILAVIIVISLVVVGLVGSNSNPQNIVMSSGKIGNLTQGGISIADALVATDGNGLVSLQNNSGDLLTITNISLGGVGNNYNTQLVSGSKILFSLKDLANACSCTGNEGTTKTCNATIYYTTQDGLQKSANYSVTIDCAQTAQPVTNPIQPLFSCNRRAAGGFFYNGTGTLENPYGVCDCDMLQDMENYLDAHYILLSNINCYNTNNWADGNGFSPIGSDLPFSGSFDGNNRSISGLFINRLGESGVGLFGQSTGEISNVGLVDMNVYGYSNIGGLIGSNYGSVNYTHTTGNVIADGTKVGGLIGYNSGRVSYSYSLSDVIGGLNYLQGNGGYVAGLVGYNDHNTISYSYSTGSVSGNYNEAGLVAYNFAGTILSCYSTSNVVGGDGSAAGNGGLVGYNRGGVVINSYATGNTSGSWKVGALVGFQSEGANVINSYATGEASASGSKAGGLVGGTYSGNVINSFALGAASSSGAVGGIEGQNGLEGYNLASISNSYWSPLSTTQSNCYPDGNTGCAYKDELSWFETYANEPMSSWGEWGIVSGSEWATADGNWSICSGSGYPWLTWEDRSC